MRTLYFYSITIICSLELTSRYILLVARHVLAGVLYLEYYSYSYRRLVCSYSLEWRAFVIAGRGAHVILAPSRRAVFIVVEVERERRLSTYVVAYHRCDRGDTRMCHRASPRSLCVHTTASACESHLVVLVVAAARRCTHTATVADPCS